MSRFDWRSFLRRNGVSTALLILVLGWVLHRQIPLFLEGRRLIGSALPNAEVRDLATGAPVALSGFSGRPVLLNFWATWCAPCIAEIPLLNSAYDGWHPKGLVVLAITNEDRDTVLAFQKKHGLRYPVYLDPTGTAGRALRVAAFPTLIFVGRDGRIDEVSHGFSPLLQWKIRRLVSGSLF